MRILLLSFYFPPDVGPGAFRSGAWVEALKALAPEATIDVLTTQPNRYASLRQHAPRLEQLGNVRTVRLPLPAHRSGFVDQSKAFGAYAWQVRRHLRREPRYDLVCATSSRLMTAFLAALIARRQRTRLFLDIRDLFVDTIGDVLPARLSPLVPLFRAIERFTFRQADHLNLVSGGFADYVRRIRGARPLSVVTNGVDELFLNVSFASSRPRLDGRRRVLYAGNVGAGQGLHLILPALARRTLDTHEYRVIGDGGQIGLLREATAGLPNVRLMPPVSRETLIDEYREADVLFLHLNDLPAFEKVLPSKLFEYLATGKPVLAGVAGYASAFLSAQPGVRTFRPTSLEEAQSGLAALQEDSYARDHFIDEHRRSRQMRELARLSLQLLDPTVHGRIGEQAAAIEPENDDHV